MPRKKGVSVRRTVARVYEGANQPDPFGQTGYLEDRDFDRRIL